MYYTPSKHLSVSHAASVSSRRRRAQGAKASVEGYRRVHLRPLPPFTVCAANKKLHNLEHPRAEGGEAAAEASAQPHLQRQRLLPWMISRQHRYRLHGGPQTLTLWTRDKRKTETRLFNIISGWRQPSHCRSGPRAAATCGRQLFPGSIPSVHEEYIGIISMVPEGAEPGLA